MKMRARILIVDDEPGMRLSLGELLRDEQYEVDCVADVQEAFDALAEKTYDVVISDIILPRQSGLVLLDHLRTNQPACKVILITGQPNIQTARQAVRLGAFDYLSKPVSLDDLLIVIEAAHRLVRLETERNRLERENLVYRKQLESLLDSRTKALLESEEKYLEVFRQMPHGLLLVTIQDAPDGPVRLVVQEINDAFSELSGHPREEVVGETVENLLKRCDSSSGDWSHYLRKTAEGGEPSFFLHVCNQLGRRYHVAVYRPTPRRLIAIFDDITHLEFSAD